MNSWVVVRLSTWFLDYSVSPKPSHYSRHLRVVGSRLKICSSLLGRAASLWTYSLPRVSSFPGCVVRVDLCWPGLTSQGHSCRVEERAVSECVCVCFLGTCPPQYKQAPEQLCDPPLFLLLWERSLGLRMVTSFVKVKAWPMVAA